jgi:hypothetical protein
VSAPTIAISNGLYLTMTTRQTNCHQPMELVPTADGVAAAGVGLAVATRQTYCHQIAVVCAATGRPGSAAAGPAVITRRTYCHHPMDQLSW